MQSRTFARLFCSVPHALRQPAAKQFVLLNALTPTPRPPAPSLDIHSPLKREQANAYREDLHEERRRDRGHVE